MLFFNSADIQGHLTIKVLKEINIKANLIIQFFVDALLTKP